ncbi:MAG: oxidoreductase, partial [Alistipes sp.]|nr:oxidoreductase [Alistipes sp.]
MNLTPNFKDYELIDSGEGEKLERFGCYTLRRPEPQAVWRKSLDEREWQRLADASFLRTDRSEERGEWRNKPQMRDRWNIRYDYKDMHLTMRLACTAFKHIGIFPEQAANWNFIYDTCCEKLKNKGA